ncbi:Bug family tripartite tricarboxylate transporter substrate binding protein [Muricoccus aerilatus]|uniref:Bug family tripartite tricarboxylate transporter substrate binding protein n=1 Tax=Muricoccus aerilatus TaxID=452982 RepID=UPI0006938140|nr:tripartite tricarboxylate transporter substrate binding protein [Roseomonas aerilata]
MTRAPRRAFLLGSLAAGAAGAARAQPDPYPSRPIRLVVPFAPGGGTDLIARILAVRLGEILGGSVVVENRAGASGAIGTAAVARARGDGYTLLFTSSPAIVVLPALQPPPPYDPERDLTPIATIARQAILFVVPAASPYRRLEDLVAAARSSALPYGTPGAGTDPHLAGLALADAAKVMLTHVPYRGGGPALNGLLTGEVAFLPALTGVARPLLEDGRARALATTNPQRHADLPDVPTTEELGYPSVDLVPWWGLFAPPNLDAPAAQRLATAAAETGRDPAWSARLEALSVEPVTFDAARTAGEIARQIASWHTRLAGRSID